MLLRKWPRQWSRFEPTVINIRTMDYNHVAVFVQVVKAGGFSAAARALGLPKSSVSRTVSLLEQNLKVRLLQRTTRKVAPTDAGAAFYEAVKGSVSAIDEADLLVREHGGAPRGLVRVTVAPGLAELPQLLTDFSRKFPGVQVELSVSSRFVDLIGEGFDLAIRAGKLDDSSLVARRIGSADLAVLAAPSYLRRRGRPKTFEAWPSTTGCSIAPGRARSGAAGGPRRPA